MSAERREQLAQWEFFPSPGGSPSVVEDDALPAVSILRRPFVDLLHLESADLDRLWNSLPDCYVADLDLERDSVVGLEGKGVLEGDSLEILLAFSLNHLLSFFDANDAFGEFAYESCRLIGQLLNRTVRPTTFALDSASILGELPRELGSLVLIPSMLDPNFYRYCQANRIRHLRDISGLSERSVYEMAGSSLGAFQVVRGAWVSAGRIVDLLASLQPSDNDADENLGRLAARGLTEGLALEFGRRRHVRRDIQIVLSRLGIRDGTPRTLRSIGDELGLTESRVQQIFKKIMSRLDRDALLRELLPLTVSAWSQLADCGGAARLDDLAEGLASDLAWTDVPAGRALGSALALVPGFLVDSKTGIAHLAELPCADCQTLRTELYELANQQQMVSLDQAAESISRSCGNDLVCPPLPSLSPLLLSELFKAGSFEGHGVSLSHGLIVRSRGDGDLRRADSVRAVAVDVVRRAGAAMHFTEVQRSLASDWPGTPPSEESVYRMLDNSAEVVSWGRGSFIHRENISFHYGFIRSVEEWLLSHLEGEDALPLLSVHGAYAAFAEDCQSYNVPSEIALYSLLRISNDPSLVYPRYPQIYAAAGFLERIPWHIILERHLEEAGDFVSRKQLRHYLVDRIGYRPEQFQILVDGLPNALYVRGKGFIHTDYVRIDRRFLDRVVSHALRLVNAEGQVSIDRVFRDCRVDCAVADVDSAELLYSLLQLHQPSDLDLPRYPTITKPLSGRAGWHGILSLVEEYIRTKAAPCGYQELEDRFVKKGGYRAPTVYQVSYRPMVFRYLSTSVIHAATIGWNDEMQHAIEEEALRHFSDGVAAGKSFSTASQLIEVDALPGLSNGVIWTAELLADLLGRGGSILVLGNARNAYLPTENQFAIATFADLVAEILETQWRGGANLQAFAEYLRAEGVILKSLTPSMLNGSSRVAVRGQEIVLREPNHA